MPEPGFRNGGPVGKSGGGVSSRKASNGGVGPGVGGPAREEINHKEPPNIYPEGISLGNNCEEGSTILHVETQKKKKKKGNH